MACRFYVWHRNHDITTDCISFTVLAESVPGEIRGKKEALVVLCAERGYDVRFGERVPGPHGEAVQPLVCDRERERERDLD